jgi:alanine racemase
MRSTIAKINVANLKHNLQMMRQVAQKMEIMPVVKADAYGHGIVEISRILRAEKARILGVAFADEAVKLRESGDTGEIFVLIPGTEYDTDLYCAYNLQASVEDFDVLKKLSHEAHSRNMTIKTHLFINTGMNRDGIKPEMALDFMNRAVELQGIDMFGILTHLAGSELVDRTFSNHQLDLFDSVLAELKNAGHSFKYIHALNSAGTLNFSDRPYNLSRCGISLYGYMDYKNLSDKLNLKPILELVSKVININTVDAGDTVGYSLNYISDAKRRIAVVPLGYGDGYHRVLANKSHCLIGGTKFPIVGTICMDQCLIDIGDKNVNIGDDVVFIGNQGGESVDAYDLANAMGTIPYEITTALKWRIPRIYV